MDELYLLKKLERVKAPPDFEQKILTQLSLRKRKVQGMKYLRLSLAGAFTTLLILFVLINVFIIKRESPVEYSDLERGISAPYDRGSELREREIIHINEAMNYAREIRTVSQEPRKIYLLEQVSDTTTAEIKY